MHIHIFYIHMQSVYGNCPKEPNKQTKFAKQQEAAWGGSKGGTPCALEFTVLVGPLALGMCRG